MKVGFTGTRTGMTPRQVAEVQVFLAANRQRIEEAHHGDCVGADAQFHLMCRDMQIPVVLHPSTLTAQRAYSQECAASHPPLAPLERNRRIVDASTVLLAAPRNEHEELRSGTWATIRYARPRIPTVVIL